MFTVLSCVTWIAHTRVARISIESITISTILTWIWMAATNRYGTMLACITVFAATKVSTNTVTYALMFARIWFTYTRRLIAIHSRIPVRAIAIPVTSMLFVIHDANSMILARVWIAVRSNTSFGATQSRVTIVAYTEVCRSGDRSCQLAMSTVLAGIWIARTCTNKKSQ